jgi:GH15 family glucan-1,4-alpha-glucosidase
MRGTYARIREQLAARGSLLYRYGNRDSPGEGAFGICSFWAAEYLAMGGGSVAEATSTLHELVGYANDLGLFAEEIDPDTGEALGNFPQAFTHVGLINAALSLSQRLAREKAPDQMIGRRIDPAAHAEAHP